MRAPSQKAAWASLRACRPIPAGLHSRDLPDDDALRALIVAQSAEIVTQQARLAGALAERDAQQAELAAARRGSGHARGGPPTG